VLPDQKKSITMSNSNSLMRTTIGMLFLVCMINPVFAQDTDENTEAVDADAEDLVEIEEIRVTGTRLAVDSDLVALSFISIDEAQIAAMGMPFLDRALQMLPQNTNAAVGVGGGIINSPGLGLNLSGMSTVNLRGFGHGSTLILVNGMRIGKNGALGVATDVSQIPIEQVERVEIILDGAAAIYGSDAVGGVVNIILKKGYKATTISLQTDLPEEGGYHDYTFNLATGLAWGRGSLRVNYNRFQTSSLASYGREVSLNDSYVGGPTVFIVRGYADDSRFVLDDPIDTSVPRDDTTMAEFTPAEGQIGRSTRSLIPAKTSNAIRFDLTQKFAKSTEFIASLNYSETDVTTTLNENGSVFSSLFGKNAGLAGSTYNPFDPSVSAVSWRPAAVYVYGMTVPGEDERIETNTRILNLAAGLNGDFSDNSWNWEVFGGYTKSDMESIHHNYVNRQTVSGFLGAGEFDVLGETNQDSFAGQLWNPATNSVNKNKFAEAIFRGDIFALPAGAVKSSLGATYNENSVSIYSDLGVGSGNATAGGRNLDSDDNSLSNWAVFGEVWMPIVSEDSEIRFVKYFNLNVSIRYDEYDADTVGGDTTYSLGSVWALNDTFRFKANYSTAFVAPTLAQAFVDTKRFFNPAGAKVFDPNGTSSNTFGNYFSLPALTVFGGNPDLAPETSKTITFGLDFMPLDNLLFDIDYHSTEYTSRIMPTNLTLFTNTPNRPAVAHLTSYPFEYDYTLPEDSVHYWNLAPVGGDTHDQVMIIDRRYRNIGYVEHEGIDTRFNYTLNTDSAGTFYFSGMYTYTTRYNVEEDRLVEDKVKSWLGEVVSGAQANSKHAYNLTFSWVKSGFTFDTNFNGRSDTGYLGADDELKTSIEHPLFVNLTFGYDFNESNIGWLEGGRLNLIVQNVGNSQAKIYNIDGDTQERELYVSEYPSIIDVRGRVWNLKLSYTF
jgi:iron complex outermembrane receptor protein